MTAIKTQVFFGFMISLAGALMMLLLFFMGFHDNPDKFLIGLIIGFAGAILITILGLLRLAYQADRQGAPARCAENAISSSRRSGPLRPTLRFADVSLSREPQ